MTGVTSMNQEIGVTEVPEVTLSEAAANHVRSYAAKHGGGCTVKIGVRTSSCSAHAYTFELNGRAAEDDYVCTDKGVRLIIDPKSLVYLSGTHIGFKKEGLQEGFSFENPNVKGTCGCGESFTV